MDTEEDRRNLEQGQDHEHWRTEGIYSRDRTMNTVGQKESRAGTGP